MGRNCLVIISPQRFEDGAHKNLVRRKCPTQCKALGADSGPSVRVRPTSGDTLKHIRTDVAFPVGGMTEEKTYSGVNNPCLKAEA